MENKASELSTVFANDAYDRLESHAGYSSAIPFPSVVLDGLFAPSALRAIVAEWPPHNDSQEAHDDGTYVIGKIGTTWRTPTGPVTTLALAELQQPRFLMALQKLTGMWGLMGDPYLFGGGLHATRSGGRLAIHADFNRHPIFKLERRLNLLTYLNEDWADENGGHLELWARDMSRCEKRVLPVFNRTVIFSTDSTSFHGQPEPVVGPPSLWRRSLALYYYSNGRADEGRPPDDNGEHTTLWQRCPSLGR